MKNITKNVSKVIAWTVFILLIGLTIQYWLFDIAGEIDEPQAWYKLMYLFGIVIPIVLFWIPKIIIPHVGYIAGLGIITVASSIGFAGDRPAVMMMIGGLIFIVTFAVRQYGSRKLPAKKR